jgi:hypothetical protein
LYSESGLLADTGHNNPVGETNISPFHNIVSNTKTAIILRWFPVQCACVFGYVRNIKRANRRTRKTCTCRIDIVNNIRALLELNKRSEIKTHKTFSFRFDKLHNV